MAREWWLENYGNQYNDGIRATAWPPDQSRSVDVAPIRHKEVVHVREVIPGTVTISREELRAAIDKARLTPPESMPNASVSTYLYTGGIPIPFGSLTSVVVDASKLERELFGDEK